MWGRLTQGRLRLTAAALTGGIHAEGCLQDAVSNGGRESMPADAIRVVLLLLVSVPLHHNPSCTCKGHSRSRHSLGITTRHAPASLMTRRHLGLHGLQPVHGLSLV